MWESQKLGLVFMAKNKWQIFQNLYNVISFDERCYEVIDMYLRFVKAL